MEIRCFTEHPAIALNLSETQTNATNAKQEHECSNPFSQIPTEATNAIERWEMGDGELTEDVKKRLQDLTPKTSLRIEERGGDLVRENVDPDLHLLFCSKLCKFEWWE
jgi:hypothetical protein